MPTAATLSAADTAAAVAAVVDNSSDEVPKVVNKTATAAGGEKSEGPAEGASTAATDPPGTNSEGSGVDSSGGRALEGAAVTGAPMSGEGVGAGGSDANPESGAASAQAGGRDQPLAQAGGRDQPLQRQVRLTFKQRERFNNSSTAAADLVQQ